MCLLLGGVYVCVCVWRETNSDHRAQKLRAQKLGARLTVSTVCEAVVNRESQAQTHSTCTAIANGVMHATTIFCSCPTLPVVVHLFSSSWSTEYDFDKK